MKFKYSHFSNLSLPYLYHLFIHSFIHFLLFSFFLPSLSYFLLNHVSPSYIYIYIYSSSAYWRRSRVPIVSWLELCCLASRSDSRHVITRWLDDRRGITWRNRDEARGKSGSRPEGGERMIGMACTKFGSFSFSNGNSKNLVYIYIPDQRPGRCGRVSIRLLRD